MKLVDRHGLALLPALLAVSLLTGCASVDAAEDPLPSWTEGSSRRAIIGFVERVTRAGGPDFVAPEDRVAVFDNDGTLWAEKPSYFQLLFALDRVAEMASDHPEWATTEPFRSALRRDRAGLAAGGHHAILELVLATHAGMTTHEFAEIARRWLDDARHPTTGRRFTDMVYQPMLELLSYLRENGFETWIVSGGGIEMIRVFAEEVYGIPPQQVVGSSIKTRHEERPGGPVIARLPEIDFIDDKAGKPVAIHRHIARRPIAAFGNSDGDLQMLQWTMAGSGPRLAAIVHHTDAAREWAYDRESSEGRLDRALDEARGKDWVIIDMKREWSRVFPFAHEER